MVFCNFSLTAAVGSSYGLLGLNFFSASAMPALGAVYTLAAYLVTWNSRALAYNHPVQKGTGMKEHPFHKGINLQQYRT